MILHNAKRMKILFIYPPDDVIGMRGKYSYAVDKFQPLGLAYIAAVLEKSGYEVQIIDAKVESLSQDEILKRVLSFNPCIVGLSASTFDFCTAKELAKEIKPLGDYTVLIGGPHVSALPEETMQEGCFDYGVLGEGEQTMLQLANVFAKGNEKDITDIKGLIFHNGSKIVRTLAQPYIGDLDTLPFPARHLLPDIGKYNYRCYKKLPVATVITTRGCPYQCTFCDRAVFGNRFRMRSTSNIVDEIEMLVDTYGVREVNVIDDVFGIMPDRVIEFCRELIARKLKIVWTCLSRVDHVSLDMLKIMKKAGCWQIAYGIESGNRRILDNINKNVTAETTETAIKWTKIAGIHVLGFLMIGLPGENESSIKDTLKFVKKLPIDRVVFFITQPFPGSELYKNACAEGKIARDVEYRYYHNFCFPKKLAYIADGLSLEILRRYRAQFYREFYLRPSYLFKRVLQYTELRELPIRITAFFRAIS